MLNVDLPELILDRVDAESLRIEKDDSISLDSSSLESIDDFPSKSTIFFLFVFKVLMSLSIPGSFILKLLLNLKD